MVQTQKITSGTKEWADHNINCYYGCSNDCKYCYAKKMAIRFGRKTEDTWKEMEPNFRAINKNYKKRKGRIMFPTSHDITEESLEYCLSVLKKLLCSGNEILITTKPVPFCIIRIVEDFYQFRSQIQFRFTITSIKNKLLADWEPNAPTFEERMSSLLIARIRGFKTSVSIEPFLDMNPIPLIQIIYPYITESIWVGKLNYRETEFNTWENIQKVVENIKKLPLQIIDKIRFKDSIRIMYEKRGLKVD